eukprot:1731249-Pyramimonas_sp.AAC.2
MTWTCVDTGQHARCPSAYNQEFFLSTTEPPPYDGPKGALSRAHQSVMGGRLRASRRLFERQIMTPTGQNPKTLKP